MQQRGVLKISLWCLLAALGCMLLCARLGAAAVMREGRGDADAEDLLSHRTGALEWPPPADPSLCEQKGKNISCKPEEGYVIFSDFGHYSNGSLRISSTGQNGVKASQEIWGLRFYGEYYSVLTDFKNFREWGLNENVKLSPIRQEIHYGPDGDPMGDVPGEALGVNPLYYCAFTGDFLRCEKKTESMRVELGAYSNIPKDKKLRVANLKNASDFVEIKPGPIQGTSGDVSLDVSIHKLGEVIDYQCTVDSKVVPCWQHLAFSFCSWCVGDMDPRIRCARDSDEDSWRTECDGKTPVVVKPLSYAFVEFDSVLLRGVSKKDNSTKDIVLARDNNRKMLPVVTIGLESDYVWSCLDSRNTSQQFACANALEVVDKYSVQPWVSAYNSAAFCNFTKDGTMHCRRESDVFTDLYLTLIDPKGSIEAFNTADKSQKIVVEDNTDHYSVFNIHSTSEPFVKGAETKIQCRDTKTLKDVKCSDVLMFAYCFGCQL